MVAIFFIWSITARGKQVKQKIEMSNHENFNLSETFIRFSSKKINTIAFLALKCD